ncbi:MAG: adenylate kinase [Spirulina sp.]
MRFIFLGSPGAGKGTQATILAERLNIPHISTGKILRAAIAEETSLGLEAQAYVDEGSLVPDRLIIALMRKRLSRDDARNGWILDGFPRNLSQAHALDRLLQILQQPYGRVINFEVPRSLLTERLLERGRKDDNPETIRRRLEIYQEQTEPLIALYERRRCLVTLRSDRSVEEVSLDLQEAIGLLVRL